MKNNKLLTKLAVLVVISVALMTLVAPAYATTIEEIDAFVGTNDMVQAFQVNHPSVSGSVSALAETFQASATTGLYFYTAVVQLENSGDAEGYDTTVYCQIQGITGEPGTSGKPNGTIYDTSVESFTEDEIELTPTNVTFTFGSDVAIVPSAWYTLVVYSSGVNGYDAVNHTSIAGDNNSEGTLSGSYYTSAGWTHSTWDMRFYVYGAEPFGYGGGDLPIYSGEGGYSEMINGFVSFIVPVVVLLLPAMLLMFLTRRADKWLLIIGITIGAGLGYYFGMVPLWLVFLVTIGLIGMAYQSVRGGDH